MERVIITIHGRVQGVFFRHSARVHAEKLGISGTAENITDGSLRIIAEGRRESLDELIAWCRSGPPLARVDGITLTWGEATGTFKAFTIR